MSSKQDHTEKEDLDLAELSAFQKLSNFCYSYNREEIDDLLSRLLVAMIGGNYCRLNSLSKERLLNYFEALEEVLPAIYDINEHIKLDGAETYEDRIAYRRLFASLKRHPE